MKKRLKNHPRSISENHFKKLFVYWKDNCIQVSYLFCIRTVRKKFEFVFDYAKQNILMPNFSPKKSQRLKFGIDGRLDNSMFYSDYSMTVETSTYSDF